MLLALCYTVQQLYRRIPLLQLLLNSSPKDGDMSDSGRDCTCLYVMNANLYYEVGSSQVQTAANRLNLQEVEGGQQSSSPPAGRGVRDSADSGIGDVSTF